MRRSMALCALAAMAFLGCGNANDTVQGGDLLMGDPCQQGGLHDGNRWQDLYACYFGPSGQASCGSQGTSCHGSADATGATTGIGHFVCGATAEACWHGVITSMIVPDGGVADPTSTLLYSALQKAGVTNGLNNMPKNSTYTFSPAAAAKIAAWIEQGAQNN